jgi:hypothetical protein
MGGDQGVGLDPELLLGDPQPFQRGAKLSHGLRKRRLLGCSLGLEALMESFYQGAHPRELSHEAVEVHNLSPRPRQPFPCFMR